MRGERAVLGRDRPFVVVDVDLGAAGGDHRLDRDRHPLREQRPPAGLAEVGDVRILVVGTADPVADEAADDGEARALDVLLHRGGDVADAVARLCLGDPGGERVAAGLEQPLGLLGDVADGEGEGAVGDVAVQRDADVDRDQIAVGDLVGAGIPCTTMSFGDVQIAAG